jgi:hypothetical protein
MGEATVAERIAPHVTERTDEIVAMAVRDRLCLSGRSGVPPEVGVTAEQLLGLPYVTS